MKKSILDSLPSNNSPLQHAVNLTKQAAVIGFDWKDINPVFDKMIEETAELKEAIVTGEGDKILDELGDVLFVCANLARHLNINPEEALKHANQKFDSRFRQLESIAQQKQPQQSHFELELLDNIWNQVKILEQSNINNNN
jgi:ATP diphosphatase